MFLSGKRSKSGREDGVGVGVGDLREREGRKEGREVKKER